MWHWQMWILWSSRINICSFSCCVTHDFSNSSEGSLWLRVGEGEVLDNAFCCCCFKLLDSPMFTKLQSEEHCVTDCDCLGHCFRKCSLVAACCSNVGWHKPFHQAWQSWSGEHQRGQCCCAVCARVSVPLLQHQGILNNHWSACCGGQPVLDALVGPCIFVVSQSLMP